jgi:argininosuccinate lyase
MPFRDAHEVVGQIVSHALQAKKDLVDLPLDELRRFSEVHRRGYL